MRFIRTARGRRRTLRLRFPSAATFSARSMDGAGRRSRISTVTLIITAQLLSFATSRRLSDYSTALQAPKAIFEKRTVRLG